MAEVSTRDKVINGILFQVCWAFAIFTQWHYAVWPFIGLLVHSVLTYATPKLGLKLVSLALLGVACDSLFLWLGLYQFQIDASLAGGHFIPIWLCLLWMGFALTLPSSLDWLLQKPVLFVIGCSVAGPISYWSGRRFEALSFTDDTLIFIALEWFVFSLVTLAVLRPSTGASPLAQKNGYA